MCRGAMVAGEGRGFDQKTLGAEVSVRYAAPGDMEANPEGEEMKAILKNTALGGSMVWAAVITAGCLAGVSHGQTLMPPFDAAYSVRDLGVPAGVAVNFGGG